MRLRLGLVGVFLVGPLACGEAPPPGPPVTRPRSLARKLLTQDPSNCFADVPGTCLTDPDFVDAILDPWVERRFDGRFPQDRRGVERLVELADSTYRVQQLATPERREAVRARLEVVYRSPPVTRHGQEVVADLGVVPNPLVPRGRTGWTVDDTAPYVHRHQWAGPAAGAALERLAKAHPEATVVEAQVRIPRHSSLARTRVRWLPQRQQVVVLPPDSGNRSYVTPRLDSLSEVTRGTQSLETSALISCYGDLRDTDEVRCPPSSP